jgi:hypothetical protein
MEDAYQEGAVDAICGGEQDVLKPIAIVRVYRVREDGAATAEYFVHAQVRELVADAAAAEEDEATT